MLLQGLIQILEVSMLQRHKSVQHCCIDSKPQYTMLFSFRAESIYRLPRA